MKRRFFDPADPWLRPLWVRLAVVALCLGWALVELATGAPGWAIIFGAAGVWCAQAFFFADGARNDKDG